MEKKAQGSMEYLLIIGGVALIAVVVLLLVFGFGRDVLKAVPVDSNCGGIGQDLRQSALSGECAPNGGGGGVITPLTETDCTNTIDDDGDTKIDCADSDCATNAACKVQPPQPPGSFSLSVPGNGEVVKQKFTFEWSASEGADSYELHIKFSDGTEQKEAVTGTSFPVTDDAWGKMRDGTTDWYVVAKNSTGKSQSSSSYYKFYDSGAFAGSSSGSLSSPSLQYFSTETWTPDASFPHLAYNGVSLQRITDSIANMRSQGHDRHFAAVDLVVKSAKAHGINLLVYLGGPPDECFRGGKFDCGEYLDYLGEFVARYKPHGLLSVQEKWAPTDNYGVTLWEIWNEPNLKKFWAGSIEDYARLVIAANGVVKGECPECKVMNGGWFWNDDRGLGGSDGVDATSAVEAFYAAGAGNSIDIMAFHPYPSKDEGDPIYGNTMYGRIEALHSIMAKNGDGTKPIFANEFGFSSLKLGEDKQAAYDLAAVAELAREPTLTGVSLFNYNSMDNSEDDPPYWAGMSFVDGSFVGSGDSLHFVISREKPVFNAYADMASRLQGCTFGSRADTGGAVVYSFNCGGSKIVTMTRNKTCDGSAPCVWFS